MPDKKDMAAQAAGRRDRLLQQIGLEPLRPEHVPDIAALHYRLLSWSFNGQFGPAHMEELYQALCSSPNFFGYVYYSQGQLVGFVTATTDYAETRGRLLGVYRHKMGKTLSIFLRNPRFLLAALESRFIVPVVFRRHGVKAEWLTFVTDTAASYAAPLVAVRLIDVVREHFQSQGVGAYMAQGFKDNPRAMKMYEKLKWRVVQRLVMHNIYHYAAAPGKAAG